MKKIGSVIKEKKYQRTPPKRKFNIECSAKRFGQMFIDFAKEELHRSKDSYEIDEHNRIIINQLYYYLIGSPNFNGCLQKGILLIGPIGSGKTVIMNTFINIFNELSGKIITTKCSKEIISVVLNNYEGDFKTIPLYVDDIGKEELIVNEFGTKHSPVTDLLYFRDMNDGLTFATSNLKIEDMEYQHYIKDRMKQMFNTLVLKSQSKRS